MDEKYAQYLLEKIKKDYNLIAQHYARTREFVSEDIKNLVKDILPQERILDSGCGNGRLFSILQNKNVQYWGIDISEELIKIAKKKYPQANFLKVNTLSLPFSDNFFDKVYSISVIHHIPSNELRLQYLKEIKRVLKPGGFLFIRVWNIWRKKDGLFFIFKYILLKLIKKTKLDFCDVFIPWKDSKGNILTQRYFHAFKKKELERLVKKAGFNIINCWKEGKENQSNFYLTAQKP